VLWLNGANLPQDEPVLPPDVPDPPFNCHPLRAGLPPHTLILYVATCITYAMRTPST
jgi:hypothetical protein